MATTPVATAKKLARYCCQECGAKELYLYCWKGCRHIQNLKTFYSETKAVCEELETLQETVYAQELRLRTAETLLKEKQQSLDVLMEAVKRLPQLQDQALLTTKSTTGSVDGLPRWSSVAVQLLVEAFDSDRDGRLNHSELATLSKELQKTRSEFDGSALLNSTSGDKLYADATSILTYYGRLGVNQLTTDLQALGIALGTTPILATSVVRTLDKLQGFTQQAQSLHQEATTLKNEINEKARTTTRLREGFAEVKMALDGKDTEIQLVHQHRCHVDKELQATKEQMSSLSTELKKLAGEVTVKTTAIHDLRALVEDQVNEKEKWQRYCWELEERLYDAVHTSHIKEHDLWKTRDAKKEETRKNMLLYMDRGMGKKHFGEAVSGKETQDAPRSASPVYDDAQTDSSCESDIGSVAGANEVTVS